ncbi:IclR family transcriptional regulator [Saliphagus sp. LR7]|uniref:IclR family transcriptional regulator n=1 Tax=Saliphagus sp. LR7 TaxID=2282654 RepID=UPI0018E4FAD3|nr:IclR family transcriptional regulator [Saliphagus sp. LR7]
MSEQAKYPVKTVKKSLDIIELLMEKDTAGITEIAGDLSMSKSIVHNHLNTLEERGYVLSSDGRYKLSFKFLEIGGFKRHRLRLYHAGRSELVELADSTGQMANLATLEQGQCVYLYQAKGADAIEFEANYEGQYEYMHSTAIGKAMMAFLPQSKVDAIIETHGLPQSTSNTLNDYDTLCERLRSIKERGYARDDEESVPGLRCVAAPIKTRDGDVFGAISVSGPVSGLKGEFWKETLPEEVQNCANIIEINSQFSDPNEDAIYENRGEQR